MEKKLIVKLIDSIGKSHEEIVGAGLVKSGQLESPYEHSEHLTLSPEKGLELNFRAENKILEKIHISLIDTVEGSAAYSGELPEPLVRKMSKEQVRSVMGKPFETRESFRVPVIGILGGWDYFMHPQKANLRIGFTYTSDSNVCNLTFALLGSK